MAMNIFIKTNSKSEARQPALDFLRGIAILSVVAFHSAGYFEPGVYVISSVLSLGFQGVELFFVVSAITMCYMWNLRTDESYPKLKFYIRRIFRIAPPFWVAIAGYLLLGHLQSDPPPNISQIVTSLLFVSAFWPSTINTVVPGSWSIVNEMVFYIFFPLLISQIRFRAIYYVVLAFVMYLFNFIVVETGYNSLLKAYSESYTFNGFEFYQFFNQAPLFLLGIFLYMGANSLSRRRDLVIGGAIGAAWIGLAYTLKNFYGWSSEPYFWLSNFLLLAIVLMTLEFNIAWKPINRLGQLSYPIYLVHFALLDLVGWCFLHAGVNRQGLLAFVIGFATTLALCWGLGAILESTLGQASSRLGKRLIALLANRPFAAIESSPVVDLEKTDTVT
jgi:peptidoglycan/LPS O-acetylase OafA/YrhL